MPDFAIDYAGSKILVLLMSHTQILHRYLPEEVETVGRFITKLLVTHEVF